MSLFDIVLYLTAVISSLACMALLFRGYVKTGFRLLLWSALCFVGLSMNNVLLFFDLVVVGPDLDLRPYRLGFALGGMLFLLYGFIWESE